MKKNYYGYDLDACLQETRRRKKELDDIDMILNAILVGAFGSITIAALVAIILLAIFK